MDDYLFIIAVPLTVFILTAMATRVILPYLQQKHIGQSILAIGPGWHKSKEGTPTMGGVAPLFAVLCTGIIFSLFAIRANQADTVSPFVLTLLFACANACIGAFDDIVKLAHRRNLGLTPIQKLILQSGVCAAYLALLRIYSVCSTSYRLPFGSGVWELGWVWYPLSFLLLLWFVNCANLTDGIDGLASGVSLVIGVAFSVLALLLPSLSLSLCGGALFGAAFGFFLFNSHPAKIFMGDTGSLFFGALAIGGAMIYGNPLLMIPIGAVYMAEGVSVVLQVLVFKITHGKRLFRMAPLHHHLEKCGWGEWRITIVAMLITALLSTLTLWSFA